MDAAEWKIRYQEVLKTVDNLLKTQSEAEKNQNSKEMLHKFMSRVARPLFRRGRLYYERGNSDLATRNIGT